MFEQKSLIEELTSLKFEELTWEEASNQKTLYSAQTEIGMVLDRISTSQTRFNFLKGEYKRSKFEYPTTHFPNKMTYQSQIEKVLDILGDLNKSLTSLLSIWDRKYSRLKNVTFQQNLDRSNKMF